jgi:hypothetical protein
LFIKLATENGSGLCQKRDAAKHGEVGQGGKFLGDNLEVVWAEFSTLS